jgi:hypothetical protein
MFELFFNDVHSGHGVLQIDVVQTLLSPHLSPASPSIFTSTQQRSIGLHQKYLHVTKVDMPSFYLHHPRRRFVTTCFTAHASQNGMHVPPSKHVRRTLANYFQPHKNCLIATFAPSQLLPPTLLHD